MKLINYIASSINNEWHYTIKIKWINYIASSISWSSCQPWLTPNFSTFPSLLPHNRQQRDTTEHGDDGPSSREVGETLVVADTVWTLSCIWAFATACRCLIWAASRWIVSPSVNGPLLYTVSKLFRRACGAISNISITPAVARNGAWPSRSFNPLWTKFLFSSFFWT